jgi:hypothetical protein
MGCDITRTIDYDLPDYENKIAVTGFIGLDQGAEVYIGVSHSLISGDKDSVLNAEVSLFEDNSFVSILHNKGESIYYTEGFLPVLGKTYSIKVKLDGYPEAISELETIPIPVEIDSVEYYKNMENEVLLNIYFNDPLPENYYAIKFIRSYNDTLVSETDLEYRFFNPGIIFDDKLFNSTNYKYERKLSLNAGRNNNKTLYYNRIDIILFSLSESGFLFFNSLEESEFTNGDMFTSATEIKSNIINGFGVFTPYSTDTLKINLDL